MAIVAISGKIGSGKDTVGNIIRHLVAGKGVSFNFENEKNPIDVVKNYGVLPLETVHVTDWKIKKFAFKLKQIVSLLTGCTVENLENQEFKNKLLPEEWNWFTTFQKDGEGNPIFVRSTPTEEAKVMLPYPNRIKPYSYRELLQRVGTEAMRNKIHENVWINALFADYKTNYVASIDPIKEKIEEKDILITPIYPNWIITDMRFPNEMQAVKDREGITIRVNRRQWILQNANTSINTFSGDHPSETALDNAKFDYIVENDGTIEELIEKIKQILIKENIIKS